MATVKQYCAECGKETIQNQNGSYPRCCNNYAYWANVKPSDGYKLPCYKGFYFYLDLANKHKLKAVLPDLENKASKEPQ